MSAKTDKQKKVIDILVTGSTLVEASKVTKIPLSTIQRWSSRDLEFVRALRVALRKYTLLNLLASVPHCQTALSVIIDIAQDETCKPSTRLQACKAIIDTANQAFNASLHFELEDIKAKLGLSDE